MVYRASAMEHLRRLGPVVFLNVSPDAAQARGDRGIINPDGLPFAESHAERLPLYREYADHEVDTSGLDPDAIAERIEELLA